MKKISLLLFLALPAFSFDPRLGEIVFGGTGCSPTNTRIVLSPDGNVISMVFNEYVAKAGAGGPKVDRKSCNIAVPITIPSGYMVAIASSDVFGTNSLPLGASSTFKAEYFFPGAIGPELQKKFNGPLSESYELKNQIPAGLLLWSSCGGSTILRANTSIVVTNSTSEQASSRIENMGALPGMLFNLQWKKC